MPGKTGPLASVSVNGPGDECSIPGRVILKTKKWYLLSLCLTLCIIRYVSRVKWSNPGKELCPCQHLGIVAIEKETFESPLTRVANFSYYCLSLLSLRFFRTVVFIFIVISTTFRPICPPAFFRCLSNSGTFTEFDKHLKKAGGHIGRNVVEITIKMKTTVRKKLNDKNQQASSQKFRQLLLLIIIIIFVVIIIITESLVHISGTDAQC